MTHKLTPEAWLETPDFGDITVIDPDGWDRANFDESWREEITVQEMWNRLNRSTCLVIYRTLQKPVAEAP